MSIFIDEVTRKLTAEGYKVSEENGVLSTNLGDGEEVKFAEKKIYNGLISMKGIKECGRLEHWVSDIRTFCGDYERAPHLAGADDAYRKILEYDEIVLAMRYDKESGFLFSAFSVTSDGNTLYEQKDFTDYEQAKEDFSSQCGLIDSYRYFDFSELETLSLCVNFALENCKELPEEAVRKLKEKIDISVPEQTQSDHEPKMTM